MKKITLLILCLLAVNLVSFAQEHGKMGLRVAAGFSTLHDDLYKFIPIPAYSLGIIFLEKDKPFSIRYELAFESKGASYKQEKNSYLLSIREENKFTLGAMSLNIVPQFKFTKNKALLSGVYCSYLLGTGISPSLSYPAESVRFSHFDLGLIVAYKYTFFRSSRLSLQIDPRFSYSLLNINKQELGSSKWTRNAVAQVGLNFIIGK